MVLVMPAHLGPRVIPDPDDGGYFIGMNRLRVRILCTKHGILTEVEDEAQLHFIACMIAGAKVKP